MKPGHSIQQLAPPLPATLVKLHCTRCRSSVCKLSTLRSDHMT